MTTGTWNKTVARGLLEVDMCAIEGMRKELYTSPFKDTIGYQFTLKELQDREGEFHDALLEYLIGYVDYSEYKLEVHSTGAQFYLPDEYCCNLWGRFGKPLWLSSEGHSKDIELRINPDGNVGYEPDFMYELISYLGHIRCIQYKFGITVKFDESFRRNIIEHYSGLCKDIYVIEDLLEITSNVPGR